MEKEKRETKKLFDWYENNVVEDGEDLEKVAELSMAECRKRWNVGFENHETVIGFYSIVFQTIVMKLKEKRSSNTKFAINIANVLEVGYDDSIDDGESEKLGNFCPYIFDLEGSRSDVSEDPDLTTVERCTEWVSKNIQDQKKTLDEITTAALKSLLEEIDVELSSAVPILPLFCTIHEQLVKYMRLKLMDSGKSEVMINFANNFDIFAKEYENDIVIEYSPKPIQKLDMKSDATGTAVHEE